MRLVEVRLDGLHDMQSDKRKKQNGRAEEKHEARCGLRGDCVGITDSDTSLCESVPQVAVRLRSHYARGYAKLGATSSWKGYARSFYPAALGIVIEAY